MFIQKIIVKSHRVFVEEEYKKRKACFCVTLAPPDPSWAMNLTEDKLWGGAEAVAASASAEVPLNLVGLRTKLFMEFNLGRNSAPTLNGPARACFLDDSCTTVQIQKIFI